MTDNPTTDEEIAEAILQDAANAASRVMERRTIQPLNSGKATAKAADKGPNWIDLMPAIPGSTVNPAADSKEKELAAMEASGIRRPGYDAATDTIIGEIAPPSTPGGIAGEGGMNGSIMPTNSASSKSSGADAAKNSTPK